MCFGHEKKVKMSNMNNKNSHHHDVLIIGSGAAGLSSALQLSDLGSIAVLM